MIQRQGTNERYVYVVLVNPNIPKKTFDSKKYP